MVDAASQSSRRRESKRAGTVDRLMLLRVGSDVRRTRLTGGLIDNAEITITCVKPSIVPVVMPTGEPTGSGAGGLIDNVEIMITGMATPVNPGAIEAMVTVLVEATGA